MARQYIMYADWNPLDARELEILNKHKPDAVVLGLNDEGKPWTRNNFKYVGSERMRAAWGRDMDSAISRVVYNCMALESSGIEPIIGLWYDSTKKTNTDLMKWLPTLWDALMAAGVGATLSLNIEKAASESTKRGETDARVIVWARDIPKLFPSFAQPRKWMLDWVESALTGSYSGEARYMAEAYSHRPDWAESKPADHWINNPSWRPGIAQVHFGKTEVMQGDELWSPGVMGVGCYQLENWGEGSRNTFARMLKATRQETLGVWSLGWAKHRPWVWETLQQWREGLL